MDDFITQNFRKNKFQRIFLYIFNQVTDFWALLWIVLLCI